MKITVNNKEDKKESKYPCLMISEELIVLFTEDRIGTIMNGEDLGEYSETWLMKEFKPFNGSIELSNE